MGQARRDPMRDLADVEEIREAEASQPARTNQTRRRE